MEHTEKTLSWETAEYIHTEKSSDWFWALGIIAFSIAVAAVLFGNILFAILILVSAFTLALLAARHPLSVSVTLNEEGITLNERLYPFSSLRSFWVTTEVAPPVLILETKNVLVHRLSITIEDISPDDVRLSLLPHLEEKEQELESFTEKISNAIGL